MRVKTVALLLCLPFLLTACGHLHDFGDWVTVQEATCTKDGQRYHVCYTCGETVYAVIPAAHEYVEDVCRICGFGAASVPVTTASAEVTFHYPGSTTPTTTTTPTDVATTVTVTTTTPTTTTASSITALRPTAVAPTTTGMGDVGWTLAEAHRAVGTAYQAFLAAKAAHTHLTGTADAPAAQQMAAVGLAQEQIRTAKEQVEAAWLLFRQNEALTMAEGGTAAAYAEETVALCRAILAVMVNEETVAADHKEAVQTTMDVMLRCSAMEKRVLEFLRTHNDR